VGTYRDVGAHIVVAEDDQAIRDLVKDHLMREGYTVRSVGDGQSALRAAREHADLLILDLGLPGIDGLNVARALRGQARPLPILMLTARTDEIDRVIGFEVGADDYVCKPFSLRELAERVKAVLRRRLPVSSLEQRFRFGRLEVDAASREARVDGDMVVLRPREFALLCELAANAGTALSREHLLVRVWGHDFYGDDRTIDAHVRRIRAKLEEPFGLAFIETVHGFGYRFKHD
jgi:two-component system response regulator ResD